MSTTAKPRARLKARILWARECILFDDSFICYKKRQEGHVKNELRVAVIPLHDVEALITKCLSAYCLHEVGVPLGKLNPDLAREYREGVECVLRALGLLRARRGKKA